MSGTIPDDVNAILTKLRILSKIDPGKKINIGPMTFTDSSSWSGAFMRRLTGEGRKALMLQLNQIIRQAILVINEYRHTPYRTLIVNHLAQAKLGIQNLSITYQSDPLILKQIASSIDTINLQLNISLQQFQFLRSPSPILVPPPLLSSPLLSSPL